MTLPLTGVGRWKPISRWTRRRFRTCTGRCVRGSCVAVCAPSTTVALTAGWAPS